jgi:glutamyl-tRNA synthetase
MDKSSPVVTRMPPSPTGHLHIGTARTALFNYLFAAHHGGEMILRSEDTDNARSTRAFETEIVEGLTWLGITWSNQTIIRQSERGELYATHITDGLASGAFYLSREESKQRPGEEVEVVRLKNPNKVVTFTDLIRGEISVDTSDLGDFVVARSQTDALYHLTVVIDDALMGVTHVLRGDDHISNTPRQILIQEALGFTRPQYAHLPLILAPDRSKMSKRHGAVALNEYRAEGFLPEAIINYLALLGWNPGTDQEIFTMEELVEQFSLDGIHKGGAVFDKEKFLWINKQHLLKKTDDDYLAYLRAALPERVTMMPQYDDTRLKRLLPVVRERAHTAKEISDAAEAGEYDFAFAAPTVAIDALKWKKDPDTSALLPRLEKVSELLAEADCASPETIKAAVWDYAEEEGRGEVLWPLRMALTGQERSPDPFTVAYILGLEETLARLRSCLKSAGA